MNTYKRVGEYIESVIAKIRFRECHEEIRRELSCHAEEIRESLTSVGLNDSAIESEIIRRMGNPVELGTHLDQVHHPKIDWALIILASAALGSGLYAMALVEKLNLQLIWFALGLIPCLALSLLKPKLLQRYSYSILFVTMGIGLLSFFSNVRIEGQPYISIGPLNIKIVDLSVIPLVVGFAGIFAAQLKESTSRRLINFIVTLVPLVSYCSIGSAYPALLYFASVLVMLIVVSWPFQWVLSYAGIGSILFSLLVSQKQFVSGENFSQLVHAERYTDFVLYFLKDSTPVVSAIATTTLIALMSYMILRSRQIKSLYGRTLSAGIATIFGVGILWGTFSNLGYLPMPATGVNIPFLSYGGSLLVGHLALLGILIGLQRRKNIQLLA